MTRLLGILLALFLAIPAVEAPAAQVQPAPASMAMHDMAAHDHHMMTMSEHRDSAPAVPHAAHHDCLGCIAPIDIGLYRPARAPRPSISSQDRPANMVHSFAPTSAPEPPPPRTSV